jgi:hypothetical protein
VRGWQVAGGLEAVGEGVGAAVVWAGEDGVDFGTAAVVRGWVDGGAGVVGAGADGAVVTACVATGGFLTVGLAVVAGAFTVGLLATAADPDDDEEEDEKPAAAAVPMMNTSPQNARNPVSTLCLAAQGFRSCGPPGGP